MKKLQSILIIDDDKVTVYLQKALVESLDICQYVHVCKNGLEALSFLARQREHNLPVPELILVDLHMPVLDGFGFLEAYQQSFLLHFSSLVYVLTTSHNPRDMEGVTHLGFARYATKPLTEDTLWRMYEACHEEKLNARARRMGITG